MRIDILLTSTVLLFFIMGMSILIINDQKAQYEKYAGFNITNSTLSNFTGNLDKIHNTSESMRAELDREITGLDIFGKLLTLGKSFFSIVWDIFSMMTETIYEFQRELQLPLIVSIAAIASLLILIAFSIVYMYFRFQPR